MSNTNYEQVIKLVGILIHMREPYDSHGSRVATYARKMTQALSIPEAEAIQIEQGAHLHDLGKLLLRADLLNVNRELTAAERAEMQGHPKLGTTIALQAGYSLTVKHIIQYHHEKWDGSGYPHGLQGQKIPMAARIVSVCDVYEALTNRRSYRAPYTHEFTQSFMTNLKGKDFDPQLIDIFFKQVATDEPRP